MLLGVIPMICFDILSDFWRKSQKGQTGKNLEFSGSYAAA